MSDAIHPDPPAAPPPGPTEDLAYEPLAEEEWPPEPEELPRRPRRRLLGVVGVGGNPLVIGLVIVLMTAGGFIGGVLVEKGQTSSSSTAAGSGLAGLASRFAALRGSGASSAATGAAAGGSSGSGTSGGFAGRPGGFTGALGSATVGEVTFVSGSTLYVTDAEGTTVKVTTSPASSITKTVKADLHSIHPGETVVVRGAKGTNGVVTAASISVGGAGGAAAGGIASLFGGGGSGRGSSAAGGPSHSGGGGPALFGE
jgi:hypothetical protein